MQPVAPSVLFPVFKSEGEPGSPSPLDQAEMSSLISCDAVLNRSKIPVPQGTFILLQFLIKIWQNLAKIHENCTKTASQV